MEIRSSREERFPDLFSDSGKSLLHTDDSALAIEVYTRRLKEFIALELSSAAEVEYVFCAFRNNVFYVWVLLDRFENEVRERIYEREELIIDEFPMFEFDFYLISRMGREPGELVSESIELVYDRYKS
jgi:hypothetical protein